MRSRLKLAKSAMGWLNCYADTSSLKTQGNAKYIFSLKHVKMYISMSGAGTESYTAAPMGDEMRSEIRNFIMKNCFWYKRSIQKYHTRTVFTLLLCISLLFTLSAGATPVYAEETSTAGTETSSVTAAAVPTSGTETSLDTDTPSESKTVRVGYFPSLNFQEGDDDEHKRGAGYEYLQKIASVTGWSYEYVYASFGECLEMLENGEIDLMGEVNYTLDRSRRMRFSSYPQGSEEFWLFTNRKHEALAQGGYSALEGCRIGVNSGTYSEMLLGQWLEAKRIDAMIVPYADDQKLTQALSDGTVEAIVAPGLTMDSDAISITSIGGGDYYFVVTTKRIDLLSELNAAMAEINTSDSNYSRKLVAQYENKSSRNFLLNRQEKKWLEAHQNTIRVGYFDDKFPFSGTRDGELSGILKTVLDTIEQQYGITITTQPYRSTDEMRAALDKDEIDLAGPVIRDLDVLERIDAVSTDAIYELTPVVIYKGRNFDETSPVIATTNSSLYSDHIVSISSRDLTTRKYDSFEDCLQAIFDDEADATLIVSARINELKDNPLMKKLSYAEIADRQKLVMFTRKDNRRVATIVNKAIEQSASLLNGVVLAENAVTNDRVTLHEFIQANAGTVVIVAAAIIGLLLLLLSRLMIGQRKLEAALAEAREANAANVAKTTFLNSMSHDIRTPMNAIIGFTNIALSMSPEEKLRNCLEKIMQSSDYLMSLINDVLDISRIESGKIKYEPVPCDITEIVDTVLSVAHGFLQGRNIEFIVERTTPPAKYVYADELRIREVLINILSNFIKFTKDGGTIRFEADSRPVGDGKHVQVRYRISDTGIGMSEEYQKHLYEEFSQESDGARTNYKGTGLGMAITKRYVDMMHGEIHVKSQQGVGTTFTVELPLQIADVALEKKQETDCTKRDLQGIRVLIAEDNDLNAEIAITLLEEKGMQVTRAIDGQDVVDQFRAAPAGSYDLILMDIMMPKQNGYEATQAIRSMSDRPDGRTIPIVAMTANAFAEDIAAAHAAGMNGHLAKPIDMDEVMKVICRVLTGSINMV